MAADLYETPSGGLNATYEYVRWEPGDDDAVLDGRFTLADLKEIVSHIEKHTIEEKQL